MMDKTNPEKAVKELTMLLMYLTKFNEGDMILILLMNWMRKTISDREASVPNP
jgi:hypothetical protein